MRILHMLYKMSIGGAETFVYNVLSSIDTEKYQIDICIQGEDITNKKLYDLCKKKGCHIYVIPAFNRNYLSYVIAIIKLLNRNHYDVVHIHMNALINSAPVFIALRHTEKVVVHSHNTQNNMGGKVGLILHMLNRHLLQNKAIIRVACREDAGHWLFGNRPFTVLDNAISISEFSYNEKKREQARRELNIMGQKVIGHVGRFVDAKNHDFLLEVFAEYVKKNPSSNSNKSRKYIDKILNAQDSVDDANTVLVMIGDGELLEAIKKKAKELAIEDKVVFLGSKTNVSMYYSAFDCLLFPSKFEGLPFVLIEAQVNGLPVVASDRLTTEMDLVGNMKFVSLDAPMEEWIEAIEWGLRPVDRLSYAEKMKDTKYNIENMVRREMEEVYSG